MWSVENQLLVAFKSLIFLKLVNTLGYYKDICTTTVIISIIALFCKITFDIKKNSIHFIAERLSFHVRCVTVLYPQVFSDVCTRNFSLVSTERFLEHHSCEYAKVLWKSWSTAVNVFSKWCVCFTSNWQCTIAIFENHN